MHSIASSRFVLCLFFVFACSVTHAQQQSGDPSRVAQVEAGERHEARADWWGFDPQDTTDSLQAAIDSGVKKLFVPRMASPWIVRPLKLASDQEIVFEEGVVVEAKRGEFHGRNDSLFSASDQQNITLHGTKATLRMHKQDYQNEQLYERSEWRHLIALRSCRQVKIEGLTLKSSGGDGIYIGANQTAPKYCEDVTVKDCLIDDQHRQGISVISVVGLLLESCVIENTQGTAPQAGIDFEPNAVDQRLAEIVVRDCTFRNNAGDGVIVLAYMKDRAEPISFKFKDCLVIQDRGKPIFAHFVNGGMPRRERIDFTIDNFQVEKNGERTVLNDFWKDVMREQQMSDQERQILASTPRIDPRQGVFRPIAINAANAENSSDAALASDKQNTQLPPLRGESYLMAYAEQGQTIHFEVQLHRDYGKGLKVALESPAGDQRQLAQWTGTEMHSLKFTAAVSGNYLISIDPGKGWFSCRSKQTPMPIVALDGRIHFFGTTAGRVYFYVPAEVEQYYATVMGEGGERVQATLLDPNDRVRVKQTNICLPYHFFVDDIFVDGERDKQGAIWSLKLEQSPGHVVEDYYVNLVGVPPLVAGSKSQLLKPATPAE